MWLSRLFKGKNGAAAKGTSGALKDAGDAIIATVECERCGERIDVRLRKSSDIPRSDEGAPYEFFVQKTVVGSKCFNRIELRLEMDGRYRLLKSETQRGRLVTGAAGE